MSNEYSLLLLNIENWNESDTPKKYPEVIDEKIAWYILSIWLKNIYLCSNKEIICHSMRHISVNLTKICNYNWRLSWGIYSLIYLPHEMCLKIWINICIFLSSIHWFKKHIISTYFKYSIFIRIIVIFYPRKIAIPRNTPINTGGIRIYVKPASHERHICFMEKDFGGVCINSHYIYV